MSGRIRVMPKHLRGLAQQMRKANSQGLEQIQTGIQSIKTSNDQVASTLAFRKRVLHDTMMERVNTVGLESLINSFASSYNQLETHEHTLKNAIDQTLPSSMAQRFFNTNRGVLPSNIADTRWSVGGSRWEGTFSSGDRDLATRYNNVGLAVMRVIGQIEDQLNELDRMAKRGHYVGGVGRAANAFLSTLNYVSETMIEVVPEGMGSSRSGSLDAIVETVGNVLEVFERHIEIAIAAAEERAAQTDGLANVREEFDSSSSRLFEDGTGSLGQEPLIRNSQVEFAIYRPELLSDSMGIESAREQQHEQRFDDLRRSLTDNLFPIVNFIANQANSMWTNISQLCTQAIEEIDRWDNFLNRNVTVEVRAFDERPSRTGGTTRIERWERRNITSRTLGEYLPDIVTSINRVRSILTDWERAFRFTGSRANEFRDAMNRNDHIGQLSERTARAMYLPDPYDNLQTFADQARANLETLASAYQSCSNQISSNMSGEAITSCVEAIQSTARYLRAIAQAVEKDFGSGDFVGEVNKLSSFPVRCSSRLVWSRKTVEELREMLIGDDGEIQWELLEYLLGQPHSNITNEMFVALAIVVDGMESEEYFERFLSYLVDEVGPFTLSHFSSRNHGLAQAAYMEQRGMSTEGVVDFMSWEFCPRKAGMLQLIMGALPDNGNNSIRQQRQALISSLIQLTAPVVDGDISTRHLIISQNGQRPTFALEVDYQQSGTRRDIRVTVPTVKRQDLANGTFSNGTSEHWERVNQFSWRITPGTNAHVASSNVIDHLDRFHNDVFSTESGVGVIGNIGDELLGVAIGAVGGSIGGPVSMVVVNTFRNALENQQARENLSIANSLTDANRVSNLGYFMDLDFVAIFHDSGRAQMIIHPVETTQSFIDAVNRRGHFNGNLTFNDIAYDPVAFDRWWYELGEDEQRRISNPVGGN